MSRENRGSGGGDKGDGTSVPGSPTHRVEYTSANGGPVSETTYSATDAELKADNAARNGATGISINPFKRSR
jgi:hypothetical protein